jgi:3-oxoacyl-[acyl-carrier-protein] synthase I
MPLATLPLSIKAYTQTSAVGRGASALWRALQSGQSALQANNFTSVSLETYIGRVDGLETAALPSQWATWDCRNNRLAYLALQQDGFLLQTRQVIAEVGKSRVAILLGTSTSSIGETEAGYARAVDGQFPADLQRPIAHSPHSLGDFVQTVLGTTGPCVTVNTACSSSAKVFAQAERLIRLGLVDAAVVGGVDTLCGSVLFGFNSLQLLSSAPCKPFDQTRNGISLGEAGGFALLTRADRESPRLIGWGESSDAHHMSSPHPQGLGAELAMRQALQHAGLVTADIDYINAHGTASLKNDEIEGATVARLFSPATRMSSTKGFMGHTLGAAGIIEAVVSLLALQHQTVPANVQTSQPDWVVADYLALRSESKTIRHVLSNNFGFGGNNASLIFSQGGTA